AEVEGPERILAGRVAGNRPAQHLAIPPAVVEAHPAADLQAEAHRVLLRLLEAQEGNGEGDPSLVGHGAQAVLEGRGEVAALVRLDLGPDPDALETEGRSRRRGRRHRDAGRPRRAWNRGRNAEGEDADGVASGRLRGGQGERPFLPGLEEL